MEYWGIGEDDALFDKVRDIAAEFTKNVRPKYEKVYRKINRILQTDENGGTLPEVLPTNKNKGNFKFSFIFEFTMSIYSGQKYSCATLLYY